MINFDTKYLLSFRDTTLPYLDKYLAENLYNTGEAKVHYELVWTLSELVRLTNRPLKLKQLSFVFYYRTDMTEEDYYLASR